VHRDLRISVTDRCNFRCTYCMPEEGMVWQPRDELLTFEEIERIARVAAAHGVRKLRLTGGEPLMRADVADVVRRINELPLRPDIALTTNGLRLDRLARPLADAGLQRVNVSLDTLDRDRFKALTHRDRFDDVLRGIRAAQDAGLEPVKVNSVLMRGVNDHEGPALVRRALDEGWRLRFIEQMPLDPSGIWKRADMVTADEIFEMLSEYYTLTPVPTRGSAPAEEFYVDGGPARVGIIASVTRPFCSACDRLRLTADGQLRNCLFAREELDLRTALRDDALDGEKVDEEIRRRLHAVVADKLPGHGINDPSFIQPARPMSAIGG